MPFQTASANSASSDSYPSGIGNRGIRFLNSNMPAVSTRSAISSCEFRQPSCQTSLLLIAYISCRRLDVVAGAVELEPVRVGQGLAGLDAQQQVVGLRVLFPAVVGVVGDDRGDVELPGDVEEALADPRLDVDAVVHQLEEVVLLAEDVLPLRGGLERLGLMAEPQPGLDLAGRAAGGGHEALRVLGDQLLVHPGPLDQPALGVGPARELEQVVQALVVPRPDRLVQVGAGGGDVVPLLVRLAPQDAAGVVPPFRGDVGLDADDRRDPVFLGLPVELGRAEHVAVVGHRHVRHALGLDLFEELLQPGGTVEHRVLGVHVQVGVRGCGRRGFRHEPNRLLRHASRRPRGVALARRVFCNRKPGEGGRRRDHGDPCLRVAAVIAPAR